MRLLHTTTLQMHEFFASNAIPNFARQQLVESTEQDRRIPEYAILSHVWGPEEVSFQDITGDRSAAEKKAGYEKVRESCKLAAQNGYAYIWIDTCCIDKTSSTELAEAINSMFQWYKGAKICYAYLSDVDVDEIIVYDRDNNNRQHVVYNPTKMTKTEYQEAISTFRDPAQQPQEAFLVTPGRYSRWFTRGWTLQELLAPAKLRFFDANWTYLGSKEQHARKISDISNIDLYALHGGDLRRMSIARRMSWVAKRQTTRMEDMAYCLLGIFDINMPLLYGEGMKAFIRLQEEILKVSDDQSLFAWMDPTMPGYRDDYPEASKPQGLLAASPEAFQSSDQIAQFYSETPGRAVTQSTNKGLQIEFLMCQDPTYSSGMVFFAILTCQAGRLPGVLPCIRLRRLSPKSEQYARIDMSHLLYFYATGTDGKINFQGFDPTKPQSELTDMFLNTKYRSWTAQTVFIRQETLFPPLPGFRLVSGLSYNHSPSDIIVREAHPPGLWDHSTNVMYPALSLVHGTKILGALILDIHDRDMALVFGVTYWEQTPWCAIFPVSRKYDFLVAKKGSPMTDINRPPQMKAPTLAQRLFDEFDIRKVQLPTDLQSRSHVAVSEYVGLQTRAELTTVAGRDMYLIHILKMV